MCPMNTLKHVALVDAREQLGRLLDAAHYAGEITVITRQGKDWAAIVPLDRASDEESQTPSR